MSISVVLHNLRSAHNVGSIFRTADGAGVSKMYITGYTPAPLDRFGRENKEILKTSLGATHTVPYEVIPDIQELIKRFSQEGVEAIAIEQTPSAVPYESFVPKGDIAYIFGNEITGIEEEILKRVPQHLKIVMHGSKESLNVSVCAGIILFHTKTV